MLARDRFRRETWNRCSMGAPQREWWCKREPGSLASVGTSVLEMTRVPATTSVFGVAVFLEEGLGDKTHQFILRLQGLDALGDVTIIDVAAVNLHEMLERGRFVPGCFVGSGEFVVERGAGFFVDAGSGKSFLIPANGCLGHTLVEEALGQPSIGLHDLRERMSAVNGLAGFLQFADGFIEQTHFAEGDAEVVVGLGIFFGGGRAGLEMLV